MSLRDDAIYAPENVSRLEKEAKVSALSAQQVSDALKRHLDPKKISVVKAGDFAKKKATAESGARPNQP